MTVATTIFGWLRPDVGGSVGAWGTELNALIEQQDTDVGAVSDVADAALPLAGGTISGALRTNQIESDFVNIGSSGAMDLDLNLGNTFYLGLQGAAVLTMTNLLSTLWTAQFITIEVVDGGNHGVTWPVEFRWQDDEVPVLTTDGRDIIVVFCRYISGSPDNNKFKAFAAHALSDLAPAHLQKP